MDLRLVDESARNTIIILPDNSPLYYVETPMKWFRVNPTTIKKAAQGQATVMAELQIPMGLGGSGGVAVWGRDVTPVRGGLLSASETFTASDGKTYKWKVDMGDLYLVTTDAPNGQPQTMIASYDPGSLGFFSKARAPTLSVTPDGMHIGDDIVATFIYMLQIRQRRSRQRRNNAL